MSQNSIRVHKIYIRSSLKGENLSDLKVANLMREVLWRKGVEGLERTIVNWKEFHYCELWHYWLWSFQGRDAKLERFWLNINIPKQNF